MNSIAKQNKINSLKIDIERKIKENARLNIQKKNMKQQTLRYQDIFKKTYLSIWEENPNEAYKFIDSLPCKTGLELSEYLFSNTKMLIQLITQLKIEEKIAILYYYSVHQIKLNFLKI